MGRVSSGTFDDPRFVDDIDLLNNNRQSTRQNLLKNIHVYSSDKACFRNDKVVCLWNWLSLAQVKMSHFISSQKGKSYVVGKVCFGVLEILVAYIS